MVKDNAANRKWCLYHDPMVYSTANMYGAVLAGKKINVTARRKRDTERIRIHNNRMNFAGETLEDVIRNTWLDAIREGHAFYRPWKTKALPGGMDLSRIDPCSLQRVVHPETGHVIYVQTGYRWRDFPQPTDPADFARKFDVLRPPMEEEIYVMIPDDPRNIVRFRLFENPPIGPVVPLVVYKKWIVWYMRKHAQKYWSPFTVVKLGTPNYMPTEGQYVHYKNQMEAIVPNMYNFSGVVVPGWIEVDQLTSTSVKDGKLYTDTLDWLNREIVAGLMSSMQMREASGKDGKAAAAETSQFSLGNLESYRSVLERNLCEYYAYSFIGDEDPSDFDVEWPTVKYETLLDAVAAAERASAMGIADTVELRQMIRYAYDFIDPHKQFKPADTLEERRFAAEQEAAKRSAELAEKAAAAAPAAGMAKPKPSGENKPPRSQSNAGATRPTAVRTQHV
jgi:hypothetical protein